MRENLPDPVRAWTALKGTESDRCPGLEEPGKLDTTHDGAMTKYQDLIREIDRLSGRLSERYRPHLVCRAGCSGCCQCDLSIFEIEAAEVRRALLSLSPTLRSRIGRNARDARLCREQGEPHSCPFLLADQCSIYASRPVICRTQGLPLLYTAEDGTAEVDFCPLNFTAPGATEELEESHLVPLESVNLRLALANLEYCNPIDHTPSDSGERILMTDLILQSSENLRNL